MSTSSPESKSLTARDPASPSRSLSWGQTLATGVFCVAFITLFQRVVGLGRSFVICGWLPTAELGKWDLSFSFLMAVGPLLVLGVPGAFGRFAEGYRKTNRIGRFIQITAVACILIYAISLLAVVIFRGPIGEYFLGNTQDSSWPFVLLPVMTVVVLFNYLTALMSSLRLHRGFAKVQATHGISFAVLCLVTVPIFAYQAIGVVAAYGIACVISSFAAVIWLRQSMAEHSLHHQDLPAASSAGSFVIELRGVLRAILPFALAIWLATFIANSFRISDRLLILNLSASEYVGLFYVGQYHAARIIPRLLSQFAMTLAAVITPHLAEDWDQGATGRAADRLASLLKAIAISFTGVSALIVAFAPAIYSLLMHDKFDLAIELLPWCMASSVTFSLAFVLQNAFWCSKQAWWTSLAFLVGLIVNVLAGLLLFPLIGIKGIVVGSFVATAATLCFMLWIANRRGFRFSTSTYVLLALPSALTSGLVGCALSLVVRRSMSRREIPFRRLSSAAIHLRWRASIRPLLCRSSPR